MLLVASYKMYLSSVFVRCYKGILRGKKKHFPGRWEIHDSVNNAKRVFGSVIYVKLRKVLMIFGMKLLYWRYIATLPTQGRNRSELLSHMMDVSDFHEQATLSFLYYISTILGGKSSWKHQFWYKSFIVFKLGTATLISHTWLRMMFCWILPTVMSPEYQTQTVIKTIQLITRPCTISVTWKLHAVRFSK